MGALNNWNWELFKSAMSDSLVNGGKINGVVGWDDGTTAEWQQAVELMRKYGYTDSQILATVNAYKPESLFGGGFSLPDVVHTMLSDLKEMDSWNEYIGQKPEVPNPEDYFQEASDIINAENRGLEDLYDQMFSNSKNLLEEQLADNNAMFADYRNQTLTNEAMANQAIAGSARYELDRQKRMAISRGASAAQRLVTNINTQLGLQAQAAQQSLNTSNALAQQLLAHRQAQAGLRQDYINAQNQHLDRLSGLRKGNAERILNYQNGKLGQAMDAYDIDMQQYNDRLSSIQGTNPWASAYTSYRTKQDAQKDTNVL